MKETTDLEFWLLIAIALLLVFITGCKSERVTPTFFEVEYWRPTTWTTEGWELILHHGVTYNGQYYHNDKELNRSKQMETLSR